MQAVTRTTSPLPRSLQEAIARAFRADKVLSNADHAARAAYGAKVRPPAS